MRRLSTIDAEGDRQPVRDESRRLRLVFNGDIYNHSDVRRRWRGVAAVSDLGLKPTRSCTPTKTKALRVRGSCVGCSLGLDPLTPGTLPSQRVDRLTSRIWKAPLT
jgi:hypothetical protein